MATLIPSVDEYWKTIAAAAPEFSEEEQHVAITLYRELAKGAPVTTDQLAAALGISSGEVNRLLERPALHALLYRDDRALILGFGGLAVTPMAHRLRVRGGALLTWCAWDSLFIPQLLDATADVESPDPVTGDVVHLEVTPDSVTAIRTSTRVMSFLAPDASAFRESAMNAMTNFCHFVFLFASRDSGETWVARHPGTFLYSLEDAVELARRLNSTRFGVELGRLSIG